MSNIVAEDRLDSFDEQKKLRLAAALGVTKFFRVIGKNLVTLLYFLSDLDVFRTKILS